MTLNTEDGDNAEGFNLEAFGIFEGDCETTSPDSAIIVAHLASSNFVVMSCGVEAGAVNADAIVVEAATNFWWWSLLDGVSTIVEGDKADSRRASQSLRAWFFFVCLENLKQSVQVSGGWSSLKQKRHKECLSVGEIFLSHLKHPQKSLLLMGKFNKTPQGGKSEGKSEGGEGGAEVPLTFGGGGLKES